MGTWDPPPPPNSPQTPQTPAPPPTSGYGDPPSSGYQAPPPGFGAPAGSGQLASGVDRLVAWIIDWVILIVVGAIIGFIFSAIKLPTIGSILSAIVGLAYLTFFYGGTGQTVGYRVMHIRVVSGQGGPLGYGLGFLRALLVEISFAVCLIPAIVSLIMIFATEKHGALHDLILGQQVIKSQ